MNLHHIKVLKSGVQMYQIGYNILHWSDVDIILQLCNLNLRVDIANTPWAIES